MALTDDEMRLLESKAAAIRETIVDMLVAAKSGHTAGPLGMADMFSVLYFHSMRHDPKNPEWEERDRLLLSNGHTVPVQYATMAHAGYFPVEECLTLRKFGSRLQGHPERDMLPGMETTSGPLGSGLSQGAGMAYALRMDGKRNRIFVMMSDGEQQEGNIWEAVMFAGNNKLGNLTALMDRNFIQIDGMTEEVMPLDSLKEKYEAFGWFVIKVDGHNVEEIADAIDHARAIPDKPTLVLAHTIPGKGVSEIEYDYRWHGKPPSKDEAARFIKQLRTAGGRVPKEYA